MHNVKFIGVPKNLLNKKVVVSQINLFALQDSYSVGKLEFNFVDSETMLGLNKGFLSHNTDTDVITFDYSEKGLITAEVFISLSVMRENAKKYSQTTENEAIRLISHGLFHCLGYKDKSNNEKEIMRKKEEEFIFAVSRETKLDV